VGADPDVGLDPDQLERAYFEQSLGDCVGVSRRTL
jgi:hypothetical protein